MKEEPAATVRRIIARLQTPAEDHSTPPVDGDAPPLAPEQQAHLALLAQEANSRLENAASEAAARGFNLGCFAGLLPGALLVIGMLFVTGWSFIGAALGLILTLVTMTAFASLAAAITRLNTVRRVYQETVQPDLARSLSQAGLSQAQFNRAAGESLPPAAPLLTFLSPAPELTHSETPV